MTKTESKYTLSIPEVIKKTYKAFRTLGFNPQQSYDIVRQLMYGEIRGGKKNHGLDRFNWIGNQKNKSFHLDRKIKIIYSKATPNIITLEGNGGIGYSHVYEAVVCGLEFLKYQTCSADIRHT